MRSHGLYYSPLFIYRSYYYATCFSKYFAPEVILSMVLLRNLSHHIMWVELLTWSHLSRSSCDSSPTASLLRIISRKWVAVISAKNHKRQSITAKRKKSPTPKDEPQY